jgi:hypothetical protein
VAKPVETGPCKQGNVEAINSDSLTNGKIFELNEQTDTITTECNIYGEQNVNPVIHINSKQTSEMHKTLSDLNNINKPSVQSKAIEIIQEANAAVSTASTNEEPVQQHRHESVDGVEWGSDVTDTVSDDCSDNNVCVSLRKLSNCKTANASDNVSEVHHAIVCDARRNFQCPLCWKAFEKNEAQMLHMKACALRHSVTTRQLLDAVELQERQAAERQALGLPDIPATRTVKKSSSKKVI